MSSVIAVVDYGMGNLRSVTKALEHVALSNQTVVVTADGAVIESADRIVFPGQGAARDCMEHLTRLNLESVIKKAAAEKPFLGVCMGMQVLMAHSEENQGVACMNMYDGDVHAFAQAKNTPHMTDLKVPHMGWNNVTQVQPHPMWHNIENNSRFYFVHSYYVDPADASLAAGTTDYGIDFVSAIARENVFAAQFHPEKSAHDGLQLLKNFAQWDGKA